MKRLLLAISVLLSCELASAQADQYIRLATLEWPPYTGLLLPQEGLSTKITSVVSRSAGYRLLTATYSWSKAVELGQKDANYDGYFPAYYSKAHETDCHLSKPIGASMLVLASPKAKPITWSGASELVAYRIGVVDGYSNGAAMDVEIKEKRQAVTAVPSDAANIRQLLDGKVAAILIDKNVLNYTLERMNKADQVIFTPKAVDLLPLHVCFKRSPAALKMRDAFDTALQTNDPAKLEVDYFRNFATRR
ncbi:MAG: transporter substrate-binding domain-containing protein [Pseudomonadota bacterium]